MRILACTTSWPHAGDPAAGSFVRDLHEGLVRKGHSVTTVFAAHQALEPTQNGPFGRAIPTRSASHDARLLVGAGGMEVNMRSMGLLRGSVALVALRNAMIEAIKANADEADLVLAHWAWPTGVWASRAVRGRQVPVVSVAHGGDVRWIRRPILGVTARRDLRGALAGLVCTNSEGATVVGSAARLHETQVLRTPMGYDDSVFHTRGSVDVRSQRSDAPVVAAGRLTLIKGFDVLLRAMVGLRRRLVVVGDGPLRPTLAAEADRLGIDAYFVGQVPPPVLAERFRTASLVVVPSRSIRGGTEGFPRVVLEALACGAPVIASATGGLPDVLPASHLVKEGDSNALQAAIAQHFECPSFPELKIPLSALTRDAVANRVSDFLLAVQVASNTR